MRPAPPKPKAKAEEKFEPIQVSDSRTDVTYADTFMLDMPTKNKEKWQKDMLQRIDDEFEKVIKTKGEIQPPDVVKACIGFATNRKEEAWLLFTLGQKMNDFRRRYDDDIQSNPLAGLAALLGGQAQRAAEIDDCMCPDCVERRAAYNIPDGAKMNIEQKMEWDLMQRATNNKAQA